MATNNSQNSQFANNADGYTLGGGTTARNLTVTGGNVTLTGAGSNTYTMPSSSDTLVGRASVDTLTNKTLTDPVINQFGTSSGLGAAWTAWTPTITAGSGTFTSASGSGRYMQIGKLVLYNVTVTITTVGTGATPIFSLPVTAQSSGGFVGAGREDALTGNMAEVKKQTATTASIFRYDNGNILSGGNGSSIISSGFYEAA